jgi:mono/diheme cytochrome c family protein
MNPCHCLILLMIVVGCAPQSGESETLLPGRNVLSVGEIRIALNGPVDFPRHVKPILAAKCVSCHQPEAQPGGIHFNNHYNAAKSGALGGFIVPGHPERSAFFTAIKSAHSRVKSMPPVGERLTSEEIGILKRWIQQGARWPDSE